MFDRSTPYVSTRETGELENVALWVTVK